MANILKSILLEELVVWAFMVKDVGTKYLVSTSLFIDPITGTRDLLIYSFSGLGEVKQTDIMIGLRKLMKYAKNNKCTGIVAFVHDVDVKRFLARVGFSTETHFMRFTDENDN